MGEQRLYFANRSILKSEQGICRARCLLRLLSSIPFLQMCAGLAACKSIGDSFHRPVQRHTQSQVEFVRAFENLKGIEKRIISERPQNIESLLLLFLHKQMSEVRTSEVKQHCSPNSKDVGSCLYQVHDQLSVCCSSSVRRVVGIPGIAKQQMYGGLLLPAGSETDISGDCTSSLVTLHESVKYGDFYLGPGQVLFDDERQISYADLTHGQSYKGLILAGGMANRVQFEAPNRIVSATLAKDSSYQGYHLRAGTNVDFYTNGALKQATLVKSKRIGNYLIPPGKVSFLETGFVPRAKLAEPLNTPSGVIPRYTDVHLDEQTGLQQIYIKHDWKISSLPVPKRMWLEVHSNGQLKYLDTTFYPIGFKGRVYPESTRLEFSADGRVVRDSYTDGSLRPVTSYSDFHPPHTELQQAQKIGSLEFPKHSFVYKRHDGSLRFAIPPYSMIYQGFLLDASLIRFSHSNLVSEATLGAEKNISGIVLPKGSTIKFDTNGSLDSVFLRDRVKVDGNWLVEKQTIKIHPNGTLKQYTVEGGATFSGLEFVRPVSWEFYDTGNVRSIYTEEPFEYDGVVFDGNTVFFIRMALHHLAFSIPSPLFKA